MTTSPPKWSQLPGRKPGYYTNSICTIVSDAWKNVFSSVRSSPAGLEVSAHCPQFHNGEVVFLKASLCSPILSGCISVCFCRFVRRMVQPLTKLKLIKERKRAHGCFAVRFPALTLFGAKSIPDSAHDHILQCLKAKVLLIGGVAFWMVKKNRPGNN